MLKTETIQLAKQKEALNGRIQRIVPQCNLWRKSHGRSPLAFNAPGAGNYKIRARITDSQNGTPNLSPDTFVVAPAQTLTITPTPSVPADPTAAGNINPKVVTLGTSFDLACAYSGSARKDIFWEQKKDGKQVSLLLL
jgi:hypothetical protein